MWPFPVFPMAGKYHWHLMGSRGRRRRGEELEPTLFCGNTDGCLLWQNANSTTLLRNSLEPLASTGGESPTYSQGSLPSHPDICLISSCTALLTHHAGSCQRTPDGQFLLPSSQKPGTCRLLPVLSPLQTRVLGLCRSAHLQRLWTRFLCQGHSRSLADIFGTLCLS